MEDSQSHETIKEKSNDKPTIKHLSISGGASWGITAFGSLYKAIDCGFIDLKTIESIYAISIGSILAAFFLLKIEPDILMNYIIKRPWENVWKFSLDTIINSYKTKGIFDKKIIVDFFSSLLKSVDLSIDITLQQFYQYSGVELHIYSTEINRFELIDISFKTHPEWLLLDAIYVSCSIPNIFSPLFIDEKCYLDGAVLLNDPSSKCIDNVINNGGAIDEIFSISMDIKKDDGNSIDNTWNIFPETNILEFNQVLIRKLLYKIQQNIIKDTRMENTDLVYELKTVCNTNTMDDIIQIMNSSDIRKQLIEEGIEQMSIFLSKKELDTVHQLG